ncbi:hypothetical protein A3G53_03110 [Candidatus Nomurabacteria bacterium RIFCSPLOWO2_12_FULL_44_11]|uniref:Dockerin domain-containing protein n=1 Tax=Candidatus Nomurabacteria bacterium RIFCSPLOWO2_12_FULL_44_11 TaxID=1801796 RepID=A0A1F6Y523_9BACT|nr:MAG: hypothetical protein A3G53_03110 [Candidatus Nomurabacteria bacterium RIFCSPLOWO2_12_FULL_44_11]
MPAPLPSPNPALPLTVPATDNFDRADATSLGSNWTQIGGANGISGNKVRTNASGFQSDVAFWKANSFNADQYAQINITNPQYAGILGPVVRGGGTWGQLTEKFYVYSCRDSSGSVFKRVNGVETTLANLPGCASGDVLRLEISGSTLKAFKNGVQQGGNIIDTSIVSGSAGLYFYNAVTSARADNWEGGNSVSTPAPAPAPAPAPVPVPAPNPAPGPIVGDFDGNGMVNSLDWSFMNSRWFTSDARADLNRDGIVNSIDFSILNRNWLRVN